MLSIDIALRLKAAGLRWDPVPGDRFVVADRDMDDEIFVVSEMTVEVHRGEHGSVIRFNGTTEWALDSVEQQEALWLPYEHQLRTLLTDRFRSLEALPGGYVVTAVAAHGIVQRHADADPAGAYARALLSELGG